MDLHPLADVGWAMLLAINHGVWATTSLPLIVLAEAVVLWGLLPRQPGWRSVWRALGWSVLMNGVSALLGLVTEGWWSGVLEPGARIYPSSAYYLPAPGGRELLWLKLTAVFWAVSVLGEGLVLMLASGARRGGQPAWPAGRRWLAALAANAVSYLAVFVVYPFWIKGGLPVYV